MQRDEAYLLDMLLSSRDAQSVVAQLTREQFQSSRIHQLASLKAIETIGEAASRISDAFRAEHPEIPWHEIIGMRNRLIHAYFEVDIEKVWETIQDDLPPLIDHLQLLVPPEEP
ncbi:MAG: hypothetical protein CO013_06300 [Syntrophobacterales bacterium CG_4_8_14_3_um_filter_58_8]|nr:MAG: hypothetical protein AUK26_03500 [Syntrophaceae bacterium CG2_30_58_14]PIV02365.1 MAG: hypothetical protein COS57_12350 [Syntrophobacterales bacterium CG03_land_8_20_14_0_80_58_14]PJC73674.1 MAG: hypothetical protein CO013_06300 [Syntrophobacterales bacterium CG_4_8_14_3_um_filter_58_8]